MSEERTKQDWWYTASVVAAIYNLFEKKPVPVKNFHPMFKKQNEIHVDGSALEKFFTKKMTSI